MHPHRVRALLDAGADARECVGLLVDFDRDAALAQRRGCREPADAGTDDFFFPFFPAAGGGGGGAWGEGAASDMVRPFILVSTAPGPYFNVVIARQDETILQLAKLPARA